MNPSACELVRKAAPELRILVRKAAELETEAWLDANLPEGVGLPPAAVMAAQVVGLREAVFGVLQRQRRRYVKYLSEHPPALLPVDASALRDLPWQAALTYHSWLEGVALRQEWAYDPDRGTELDRRELEDVLRRHLREAVGCGGVAGLRSAGGLPPGLAPLGHRAAGALRRRLAAWAGSRDAGARALHRAVSDRAANAAVRGVVLRDGAGRPVAAATYTVIARGELTVRYLGALEAAAAGSGLQMVRELAGLAALEGRGLVLWSAVESEAVFTGLGFSPEPGGRFALSAASARKLAQTPPGPLPAWTRAGWLEGPEVFISVSTTEATEPVRKVGAGIPEELGDLKFGSGEVAIRDAAGVLLAVARYELPEEVGDLVLVSLWVSPKAPPPTGRRLVRALAAAAARHGRGLVAIPVADVVGLYERLGMAKPGKTYSFTPKETAAFASGLTQSATFTAELSWELAVAGASEYLERDVIPGVVEDITAATHRQLIDTLIQGLDRGEGTNDLIARIRALDDTTFGLARAERIARTEVITANRAGAHQIALDAGATSKQWVSRLMPNTRAWHRDAHGQVVPIRDPFVVSNRKGEPEELMFPGDRSRGAGPDNVIQCVCASLQSKPGVSDDAAYDEHGLASPHPAPGPVVAVMPEPVRKGRSSLEDLRAFVRKDKGGQVGGRATSLIPGGRRS